MALLDVELLAVLLQDVNAAVPADGVGDPGPDEVGHRSHGDGGEQGVLAVGDVEACEQHGGLARHGDAGRLEHHQDEYPEQPQLRDDVGGHLHDGVREGGDEHEERSRVAAPP
jgi:hypothetical protein